MADEPDKAEVVFAFSPALAVQGLLDFTKSEHSKIYKSAIREVCKEPFDCEAEGLFQFLKDVQDRADEMGWSDGILNITMGVTDDNEPVQERIIENYCTISLEKVIESKLQYINEQGREAQDTYMLYKCLMASLTNAAKKRISLWSDQYRIGNNDLCSGVSLLKIIIRESHLDTNATTNQMRTKLSNLDSYILTVDSDIGKFNQYVKLLLQSLTARNQKTSDLLINLFKGYGAVSDEVFRAWLMRKHWCISFWLLLRYCLFLMPCHSFLCLNPHCSGRRRRFVSEKSFGMHLQKSTSCWHFFRARMSAGSGSALDTSCLIKPCLKSSAAADANTVYESSQRAVPLCCDFVNDNFSLTASTYYPIDDGSVHHVPGPPNVPHQSCTMPPLPVYFPFSTNQKCTVALLKLLNDMNAPDYAFKAILTWARAAIADGFSFRPEGGKTHHRNVD
jgi:hypothetical protein